MSRAPTPIMFPEKKNENEFRVVILGESAAMGEPEPAYGPARMLHYLLSEHMSNRKIRVINAAMTAINSHVIREIARDLSRMQPDVVIVYMGNNEVVGPFGPGTVFQYPWISQSLNRLRVMCSRLHFASVVRANWFKWNGGDAEMWRGMEMFNNNRIEPTHPKLPGVYRAYSRNLSAIVREIIQSGAIPVLCTVAVNLADQEPFDGTPLTNRDLDGLKLSRDQDALRFRADSQINQIIRETAKMTPGAVLLDTEAEFEKDEIPGNRLFLDHVHFTFEGGYTLAGLWFNKITGKESSNLSLDAMADLLLWNTYSKIETAEVMMGRFMRPPFSNTANNRQQVFGWAVEKARLYREAFQTPLDDLLVAYRERMKRYPDDFHFAQQVSRALLMEDRFQEAGEMLYSMHQQLPHRAEVRGWMCIFAAIAGRTDRIWSIMTDNAPPLGELPADMLVSGAETLWQSGYQKESLAMLENAVRRFHHRPRLQGMYTSRLAQTGNVSEALDRYHKLVGKRNSPTWLHQELAVLLYLTGDTAGAERLLAPLKNATDPDERIKWVQFKVLQHKYDEAAKVLEEIISAKPSFALPWHIAYVISMNRRDYDDAIRILERIVELEPWLGDRWLLLGQLHERAKQKEKAIHAYAMAYKLMDERDPAEQGLERLGFNPDNIPPPRPKL